MPSELSDLLKPVVDIAQAAGEAILPFYQSDSLAIRRKSDNTPVTDADIAAHQVIASGLAELNDWPLLSEEDDIPPFSVRKDWSRFWISDPLDGTRGFIHGHDEFTVNIAVIESHEPVLGVIYAPVSKKLYYAARDVGAFMKIGDAVPIPLRVSDRPFEASRFVVGKYHKLRRIQPVLEQMPKAELLRLNSSLKFTAIASGEADIYARFGPISEWDTAAGHCILEEAGGKVVDFNGQRLQYNAGEALLCPPFLAVGNPAHIHALIELFKEGESRV
ncbi:MAG: 3'(2'),5'-bisphosphate nucleotidase CysQ [Coxiellaceae bacterium]|nr:3'(2'),5'-bisphosphate nucleotidase CysQ [Coxiellaceae bacterium]